MRLCCSPGILFREGGVKKEAQMEPPVLKAALGYYCARRFEQGLQNLATGLLVHFIGSWCWLVRRINHAQHMCLRVQMLLLVIQHWLWC